MSRTYKAVGINLKASLLGEADRVLTILTKEHGLIRAVAPGARKPTSKMSGRSGLFVMNDLLLAKGKSIDKITQAETLESYPGLGRNLKKLTAGQYLAELVLNQAIAEVPQSELFYLFTEHLSRIEQASDTEVLARLTHAIYQLLAIAGVAPQVQQCCISRDRLIPDFNTPDWQVGFSAIAGGAVTLEALDRLQAESQPNPTPLPILKPKVKSAARPYAVNPPTHEARSTASVRSTTKAHTTINALELSVLQQLANAELPSVAQPHLWYSLERLLRQYAQYHFDRSIRSASLMETCFAADLAPG